MVIFTVTRKFQVNSNGWNGEVDVQLSTIGLLFLSQPLNSSEQHTIADLEFSSDFGYFHGQRKHCLCIKFIYSDKATKFCEISTIDLTGTIYIGQIYGGDFPKIHGLLRIYNLYQG